MTCATCKGFSYLLTAPSTCAAGGERVACPVCNGKPPAGGDAGAAEERDALLSALGWETGPFRDALSRKVILDDSAALRPEMVKARQAAQEAQCDADDYRYMLGEYVNGSRSGVLGRLWKEVKRLRAATPKPPAGGGATTETIKGFGDVSDTALSVAGVQQTCAVPAVQSVSEQVPVLLKRFGHHPDPAIDFEIEVAEIESILESARLGLTGPKHEADRAGLPRRVELALLFQVGGDPSACAAKAKLRAIAGGDAGAVGEVRMWPVVGPCQTPMWETNRTGGQFSDPVAALRCALSLPLPTPKPPAGGDAGAVERFRQALEDVCDPLGYLQRLAEAEGAKLGGMAYSIANDIATVQRIARDALALPAPVVEELHPIQTVDGLKRLWKIGVETGRILQAHENVRDSTNGGAN